MSENPSVDPRSVAVIGGGIAGITAAIKLGKLGYNVTLFEKAQVLGGNLSSNSMDNHGERWEVYPHIFGDWYDEFWTLLEDDFGLRRDDHFLRRDEVRMALIPTDNADLKTFESVTFARVATPTTLTNLVNNCYNGVLTPRDSILFGYTYLDLVSAPATSAQTSKLLADLDVTGFLYSRPYMNNEIAEFHDEILKIIWSVPSDFVSAKAYQKLIRHTLTFPVETPFAWLIKGPLETTLLDPITATLERELKGRIRLNTTIEAVALDDAPGEGRAHRDGFVDIRVEGAEAWERFRYAVIATTARVAGVLALGDSGPRSLVSRQHNLARLREAQTARIPVVYLYFNDAFLNAHRDDLRYLPDHLTGFKRMMPEAARKSELSHPGMRPSEVSYDISIHNIASVWNPKDLNAKPGEPVLVLAASRASAIKAAGPEEHPNDPGERQGWEMLARLQGYLPFINPGSHWGDSSADVSVDWERTRVITNKDHQLFLNDTGSNEWRPKVKLEDHAGKVVCTNVFFAGDYCMTDVDMATVEAAVQSGVLAVQALQWENLPAPGAAREAEEKKVIRLRKHTVYSPEALLVAKLAATPAAFMAAMSATYERSKDTPSEAVRFPFRAAVLATSYWADWLKGATQLAGHMIPHSDEQNAGPPGYSGRHDRKIGVVGLAANLARALVVEGPRVGPQLKRDAGEVAYGAWRATVGRTLFPNIRETWDKSPRPYEHIDRRSAKDPPSTWSDLLDDAFGDTQDTAGKVSDVAFGGTAGTVHFLRTGDLLAAIAEGAAAYRRRDPPDEH